MPAILRLDRKTAIESLEDICRSNTSRQATLPSGRRVLITPMDGMEALAEALEDPDLQSQIRASLDEYRAGDFEAFDP